MICEHPHILIYIHSYTIAHGLPLTYPLCWVPSVSVFILHPSNPQWQNVRWNNHMECSNRVMRHHTSSTGLQSARQQTIRSIRCLIFNTVETKAKKNITPPQTFLILAVYCLIAIFSTVLSKPKNDLISRLASCSKHVQCGLSGWTYTQPTSHLHILGLQQYWYWVIGYRAIFTGIG